MKITFLCSYLCVDYRSHPKLFGWSWNRQHSPQEHQYGQDQWYDRGTDHIIQHYDEIADQLRVGWQQVVHGKQHLQQTALAGEKLSALFQLLDQKLPAETRGWSGPHMCTFLFIHTNTAGEKERKREWERIHWNMLELGYLGDVFWHTASLQYNHCLWLSLTSLLRVSPASTCLPAAHWLFWSVCLAAGWIRLGSVPYCWMAVLGYSHCCWRLAWGCTGLCYPPGTWDTRNRNRGQEVD